MEFIDYHQIEQSIFFIARASRIDCQNNQCRKNLYIFKSASIAGKIDPALRNGFQPGRHRNQYSYIEPD